MLDTIGRINKTVLVPYWLPPSLEGGPNVSRRLVSWISFALQRHCKSTYRWKTYFSRWYLFYNDRSAQSLLERFTRFDCYFSCFVSTKVRGFLAMCTICGRIHNTESFFDCTVPWWCSKYYASRRYLFFYAHKGFLKISCLGLKAIFKLNISFLTFPFSLFNFGAWFLNFVVEFEYAKLRVSVFSISLSFTSQVMNRALIGMWRLTVRVRVTLFVVRGHKLVYVLWKMPLQLKLILMTNLFSPQNLSAHVKKRSACMNNALSFSIDWFFLAHSRPYHHLTITCWNFPWAGTD